MSNTDLINELRTEAARWAGGSWPHAVIKSLLTRAADALEASDAIVHLDVSTEQHRGDGLAADLATAVVRAERAEADNRRLLEERANLTSDAALFRATTAISTMWAADPTRPWRTIAETAIRAALEVARGEDEMMSYRFEPILRQIDVEILSHVATLDTKAHSQNEGGDGTVTWWHILREEVFEAAAENDPEKLRAELVQVAAVAVKMIDALDATPATERGHA